MLFLICIVVILFKSDILQGSVQCLNKDGPDQCSIPIKHREKSASALAQTSAAFIWSKGDNYFDWQGAEPTQSNYHGVSGEGTPLIWTTSSYTQGNPTVAKDGYGFSPLNKFGSGYWMMDVDMDCSKTQNGWFEFKTYSTVTGWEPHVDQTPVCGGHVGLQTPSTSSNNHKALCGKMSLFVYASSGCVIDEIQQVSHKPPVTCGIKRELGTRVVHGHPSKEGAWPWMAEILYKGNHGCGAVLISPTWAVTAGHCVRTAKTYGPWATIVRLGETNRHTISGKERDYFVKTIIKHPLFDHSDSSQVNNDYDIALLELITHVDTSTHRVTQACIPTHLALDHFVDAECWLTGWGSTKGTGDRMILQQLQVNVSPAATCSSLYGQKVSNRQVCAGNGTKQACHGDSGSPLACKLNDVWYVVGVVSWGDDNCTGRPSIFTRISAFIGWIQHETGLNFEHTQLIG